LTARKFFVILCSGTTHFVTEGTYRDFYGLNTLGFGRFGGSTLTARRCS
jgi:hypothetical protein